MSDDPRIARYADWPSATDWECYKKREILRSEFIKPKPPHLEIQIRNDMESDCFVVSMRFTRQAIMDMPKSELIRHIAESLAHQAYDYDYIGETPDE